MAGKIAETLFQSGPLDELLATDVYNLTDALVRNRLPADLSDTISSTVKSFMRDGALSDSAFKKVLSLADNKIGLDTAALVSRIEGLSDSIRGPLNNISSAAKEGITGALKSMGVDPTQAMGAVVTIGDVATTIANGDIEDARGIVDLISEVTGSSGIAKILDLEAEAALISGILGEAIRLQIPGAIDALVDLSNDRDDRVVRRALEANLLSAIINGQLTIVRNILTKIGRVGVLTQVPQAIKLLLSTYRFKEVSAVIDYDAKYTELKTLLDDIDPNWFVDQRDGVEVTKLSPFSYASDDAKLLFRKHPEYLTEVMISDSYQSEDVNDLLKAFYPSIVM
ncbi:MAG: hypothetical protein CL678_15820 [Bdellovibrionaceae bacterium]|nr:hypothetical protein [Pseudobdellovibrionaceae bacterium]